MSDKKILTTPPIKVSRSIVFVARAAVLIIFVVWVAGIFYFHSRMKDTERQILELKQKKQQHEELLRRQAIYQRAAMERKTASSSVQNAVDAFKQ